MHQITSQNQQPDNSEILPAHPYVKYLPEPTSALKELVCHATGKLYHVLTNDYLFRALLQENNDVLKGLMCSVLHLSPDSVKSVTITNPILLGKELGRKTFFLDINVLLNDDTLINIEMQVANLGNWPERSLGYLCRSFDSLNKGDDYIDVKSAIHISFLDYTLFPSYPEFHSVYKLKNDKNSMIYTDKFMIHVINLTCIDLATEEDRFYGIDQWASFFKAKTWEEINMLAKQKPLFESAAETIYQLDNDPGMRWLCEAQNATLIRERYYETTIAEQKATLDQQKAALSEKDAALSEKDAEIERLKALLAEQSRS